MEQITITRAEFREKIVKNPRSYGIVRYLREHPEEKEGREMKLLIEELSLAMVLAEIEADLFSKPGTSERAEEEGEQDEPF